MKFSSLCSLLIASLFLIHPGHTLGQLKQAGNIFTNDQPYKMVISPDNKFAYIAMGYEVGIYSRDLANGSLTYLSSLKKMHGHDFYGAYTIDMGPDGHFLYVLGTFYTFVLERNNLTGELIPFQSIPSLNAPSSSITANNVQIPQDQKHAYITARDVLYVYNKDLATDTLSIADTVYNGGQGDISCVLSKDQKYLYVSGGNGIRTFTRNITTGALKLYQTITGTEMVHKGLPYSIESVVSPDDRFIYLVSNAMGEGGLVVLERDRLTDTLIEIQSFVEDPSGFQGDYRNPNSITLSPDGKLLLVNTQKAVRIFNRDSLSGRLQQATALTSTTGYNMGGRKTIDWQSRYLYVTPVFTDSVYAYSFDLFLNDTINVCASGTIKLMPTGASKSYKWSDGSTAPYLTAADTGKRSLEVTDIYGITWKDTVNIQWYKPYVNLGNDTTLEYGESLVLYAGDMSYATYKWNISTDSGAYLAYTNNSTAPDTLLITVAVTDNQGCSNADSAVLTLNTKDPAYLALHRMKLYPNPSKGKVQLDCFTCKPSDVFNLVLMSVTGTMTYIRNINLQSVIDLSLLREKGLYIARITNEKGFTIANQKIMIQ